MKMQEIAQAAAAKAPPGPRKAPRRVILTPDAFADTWHKKPAAEVCVGLRTISSAEVQGAKALAEEQASRWYPRARLEDLTPEAQAVSLEQSHKAFSDGVMRHCVARALCDPNDVTKPFIVGAEDRIREAFREETVRRLWDELLILNAATAVTITRADDEDLARLGRILCDGRAVGALPPGDAIEVRTLLAYVHTLLVGTGQAHEADVHQADQGYSVRSARS